MDRRYSGYLSIIVLLSYGVIAVAGLAGCSQSSGNSGTTARHTTNRSSATLPAVPDAVAQIFERHCGGCHTGQAAPKGLELRRDRLIQTALNIPSTEKPDLLRIKPGDPDNSYVMWKIRRDTGIAGKPMPPAAPQLSESDMKTIADWIAQLPQ